MMAAPYTPAEKRRLLQELLDVTTDEELAGAHLLSLQISGDDVRLAVRPKGWPCGWLRRKAGELSLYLRPGWPQAGETRLAPTEKDLPGGTGRGVPNGTGPAFLGNTEIE